MINLPSIFRLGIVLGYLATGAVQAAPEGMTDITITGEIVEQPVCEISNGETIHVPFGLVGVNKVASGDIRKDIPYKFTCDKDATGYGFYFFISGIATDFDKNVIATKEQNNLGVKLYIDGRPFEIMHAEKVTVNSLPKLEAQLVQKSGATLKEGDFSAIATLNVIYQ